VPQPKGGDRELDRHRGHITGLQGHVRRVGAGVARIRDDLEERPAVGEDVVEDFPVHDAREEVALEHPLVMLHDRGTRRLEELGAGRALSTECPHHAVVEADERQVDLGHDEVLVVAQIGDQGPAPLGAPGPEAHSRQIEPIAVDVGAGVGKRGRGGGPHLQAEAIAVEPSVHGISRAPAVEAVEVQSGGAALGKVTDAHRLRSRGGRPIEREIVIHELPEVREAGGNRGRHGIRLRARSHHGLGEGAVQGAV
jgi:hypothetical protein